MSLSHVEKSDRGLDGMERKEEIKAKTASSPSFEQANLQPGLGSCTQFNLKTWTYCLGIITEKKERKDKFLMEKGGIRHF